MDVIHIYHTNDLHSHFEHWPRIHHFLSERKKWHEEAGEEFLLFDIGDHADRFHPLTEATRGNANIKLLNKTGYHAVTIGNNEGITFPYEDLDHLYDQRQFEVLLANLYKSDGSRPTWAKENKIYETKKGIKLAVTGLTASFAHLYHLLGWTIQDPMEELKQQLSYLKGKADIMVLLSHLGIHDDEQIGHEFPEIDVVIGGHTHHILHEGKMVDNTLLTCAGKYGMFVGHITLTVDSATGSMIEKKAWLYDTNDLPSVVDEEVEVERLYKSGKDILAASVVTSSYHHTQEQLAKLLCEATREWCQADCAFINEGLILENLPSGKVTKFDLLKTCPHPINPCVVELTGAELREVLLQTMDEKWKDMQIFGLGFRGKIMGKMVFSGIDVKKNQGHLRFFVQGELIEGGITYKVAIPDMFTFGRFFPSIFRAKNKQYFLPEFMRHLLEWKLGETERQPIN
ncbi:bifunctional metallophosphatase/5'-nucleotidase [Bacillus sp. V3B]|uniref:bifunctional metallophosphatase/5'-nucleotidase n=1 Tax=Bacillus sp. V3B TaxID=2804915 RepID=UPI00210C3868|nr:bifunctional UDP-sugar hydrolase/5'-nucleotidase [Bacillus sp. V3B]MCQ6276557.1 bifunctional metallophosphatase/5'-nucleotidase [Bacillus sp. V3B]